MRFFFWLSSILVLLLAVFALIADRMLAKPCRYLARSRQHTHIFSLQTVCHARRRLLEFSEGHFTRAEAEEAASMRRQRERSEKRKQERAQKRGARRKRPRPGKHHRG